MRRSDPDVQVLGTAARITFQRVPKPKATKVRIHLDVQGRPAKSAGSERGQATLVNWIRKVPTMGH